MRDQQLNTQAAAHPPHPARFQPWDRVTERELHILQELDKTKIEMICGRADDRN